MNLKELDDADVGKWVEYDPGYKKEYGRIKSWNDRYVFVVYSCAGDWDNFQDYTGAATNPKDLSFREDPR